MIKVGDIVEHTVYGCGMVEELYVMADYATIWVFDDKKCPRENDQRAEVSLRYLKPFVAYVET